MDVKITIRSDSDMVVEVENILEDVNNAEIKLTIKDFDNTMSMTCFVNVEELKHALRKISSK